MIFLTDVVTESVLEDRIIRDGEDFVGEFFGIPEIVFEGRPDNFGNAGLVGENQNVAVVGGLESGEAKGLGDGAHDENVGQRINVA